MIRKKNKNRVDELHMLLRNTLYNKQTFPSIYSTYTCLKDKTCQRFLQNVQ